MSIAELLLLALITIALIGVLAGLINVFGPKQEEEDDDRRGNDEAGSTDR